MQNELLKQIIMDLKLTKDTADDTEGSNICAAKENYAIILRVVVLSGH